MANYDDPNGFTHVGGPSTMNEYTSSAAIAVGDLLSIASGKVLPYVEGDGTPFVSAIGVAATSASATDEAVLVYDDPTSIFRVQTSGTYTATTDDGTVCDVEGTTGIMEANEDAAANETLVILGQDVVKGAEDDGAANARIRVRIARHTFGSAPMRVSRSGSTLT